MRTEPEDQSLQNLVNALPASRDKQEEACRRKRRYPMKVNAEVQCLVEMNRPGKKAPPLTTYQCPICRGWHLTREKR